MRITKNNSNSTIVWNPGLDGAATLSDVPDACWQSMVCIEPGNALNEKALVLPGNQHTLFMQIGLEYWNKRLCGHRRHLSHRQGLIGASLVLIQPVMG